MGHHGIFGGVRLDRGGAGIEGIKRLQARRHLAGPHRCFDDGALKLLPFGLLPRDEIEADNRPHEPPERLGHQRDALHPRGKPDRVDHGRDEKPQRAKGQKRPRQSVEPVDHPIEQALARLGEFGGELAQGFGFRFCIPLGPGLGVFTHRPEGLDQNIPAAPEQKHQKIADQPHDETRARCASSMRRKRGLMNSSARRIQPPFPPSRRRANLRLWGRASPRA